MSEICPCIDCICIPICRSRHYSEMISICQDAQDYLYEESGNKIGRKPREDFSNRLQEMGDAINNPELEKRFGSYKYKEILARDPKYYRYGHKTVFKKESK